MGVAYLLVQRKGEVGEKVVERIRVFAPDEGFNPSMLFYVGEG